MRLMTKKLEQRFARVGSQKHLADPIILAHYSSPCGDVQWYAIEYDPDRRLFYGYITVEGAVDDAWDYFSLDELAENQWRPRLRINRNLYWREKPISQAIAEYSRRGK